MSWWRFIYLVVEPLALLAALVVLNWTLYVFVAASSPWVGAHLNELNTGLFLYLPLLPILLDRRPGVRPDGKACEPVGLADYGLAPAGTGRAVLIWLAATAVVAPLFTALFYAASICGPDGYHPRFNPHLIPELYGTAKFHLLHVALPEEFFFRAYAQSRLNQAFVGRIEILGAPVGWGLPLASVLFAITHPLLGTSWYNLDTFFPGLLFGWLRERSGSVVAPILMHVSCNLLLFSLS